jgi:hypothetical protein
MSVAEQLEAYEPLESVWYGEEDAELVEQLLGFYPRAEPRLILDATINGGRFWRRSVRPVVGLDLDSRHRPTICADNAAMPFGADVFDVVIYDPPHIPNQGRDQSKDFNTRFGLGARSAKENGYSFSHTFPAFMAEAWRVLVQEGVLFCKITDYVHNHRYQWAHVDLIQSGREGDLQLAIALSRCVRDLSLIRSGKSLITVGASTVTGSFFVNPLDANDRNAHNQSGSTIIGTAEGSRTFSHSRRSLQSSTRRPRIWHFPSDPSKWT